MAESSDFALAAEFAPVGYEDWLAAVADALKGADFAQKLVSRTHDGLRIEPLYRRVANAEPIAGRGAAMPWQVMQRIEHPDPACAIAEARQEIEGGATALSLVFAGAIGERGYGLEASPATLSGLFDSISGRGVAIELDLGPAAHDAAREVAAEVQRANFEPQTAEVRFGLDPLGASARNGSRGQSWAKAAASLADLVLELRACEFRGPLVVADARVIHDAGGGAAHELGFALASALEYLRAFEAAGIAIDEARRLVFFRLSADADQFLTMAKFRALRLLWARIEQALQVARRPVFVAAETAWRTMSQRDPWVNILRSTVAAAAAGLAGADAVALLPFTAAIGLPDRLARRIARNTQLILLEEAHLARVLDPAAGSGAIEHLSDALCDAAWRELQDIEQRGGVMNALEAGLIQAKVADVCQTRRQAVAARLDVLTGSTGFVDLAEAKVAVLDVKRRPPGSSAPPDFTPLTPHRLAEPFEALRDRSDRILAMTGARPKIFLANLGPAAAFRAAANFAKNFFESGGIEAVGNEGFATPGAPTDVAALLEAFRASGAALACLCSSAPVYAAEAEGAAAALRGAGAKHIYIVGRSEPAQALSRAGATTVIEAGSDALATLTAAQAVLAVH